MERVRCGRCQVLFSIFTRRSSRTRKAMDHTRDVLLQSIQADQNQNPAESPDETNNIHFAVEHTTGVLQEGLMSPSHVAEDSEDAPSVKENESETESESSEHIQLALSFSDVLINNFS